MARTEYQYVVMQYSTDELILVDMDVDTGEYRERFDIVIPDRDVCFAVVMPEDDDMGAYIQKHGNREFILGYVEQQNEKLKNIGLGALQFESAKDNGWTLEQINKIITCQNYIDTLIREKDAIVVNNEIEESEK